MMGANEPTGTVDFYPNSGEAMPGCETSFFDSNINPFNVVCSHNRVMYYYAESVINPEAFAAVRALSFINFKSGHINLGQKTYMGFGCSKR
jgi:hypothetical protein